MATWSDFATADPQLALAVRALLYQYGPGLGYLATVRADGGPRVHPISPVVFDEGLFCFLIPSRKRDDLEQDGRYTLHSYPPEQSDDEAYLSGTAVPVTDPDRVTQIARKAGASPSLEWRLFELLVDVAIVVRRPQCTTPGQMPPPASRTTWHPGSSDGGGGPAGVVTDPVQ